MLIMFHLYIISKYFLYNRLTESSVPQRYRYNIKAYTLKMQNDFYEPLKCAATAVVVIRAVTLCIVVESLFCWALHALHWLFILDRKLYSIILHVYSWLE